jgi:putative peptidoglycan lipid II flippase
VRQIGRLMVPWLLGAMIYKANPVVDRLVASEFSAGAISILGYAAMLAQLAVFVSSKGASLAVFPTMSRLVNNGQKDRLPEVISTGLKLILVAVVPVGVLLLMLGELVATVVFQRGAFSPADSRLTALALAGYSGSIIALSLGNVLTYVYYALQDTRTPAIVGSVGMVLNVGLALLLRHSIGFIAPAVSYSVMTVFNFVVLVALLRRRLGQLLAPDFFGFGARIALAGLAMVAVLLLTRQSVALVSAVSTWPAAIQLAYHGGSALLAYLLCWTAANRALVGRAIQQIGYRVAP